MFALRLRGDPTGPRELEDGRWQQDPELAYRDWGLAGDLEDLTGVDFDDRDLWRATNPSLDVVRADGASALTTLTVERERRAFRANPRGFARERFGVWPKRIRGAGGVIPLELWQELATSVVDAGRPDELAFAVVVAADRSFTTIAAVGPQDDGRLQASIVAYERGTEWVVDRMVASCTNAGTRSRGRSRTRARRRRCGRRSSAAPGWSTGDVSGCSRCPRTPTSPSAVTSRCRGRTTSPPRTGC
jgi:hypothetical protein